MNVLFINIVSLRIGLNAVQDKVNYRGFVS